MAHILVAIPDRNAGAGRERRRRRGCQAARRSWLWTWQVVYWGRAGLALRLSQKSRRPARRTRPSRVSPKGGGNPVLPRVNLGGLRGGSGLLARGKSQAANERSGARFLPGRKNPSSAFRLRRQPNANHLDPGIWDSASRPRLCPLQSASSSKPFLIIHIGPGSRALRSANSATSFKPNQLTSSSLKKLNSTATSTSEDGLVGSPRTRLPKM